MIHKITNPLIVEHLFSSWQETCIWSALQGIMGDIYAEDTEKPEAAMVILGDFCFLAGTPNTELVAYKPSTYKKNYIIMVPENDAWSALIENHYKAGAEKNFRYAIKKNAGNFNKEKLEQAVAAVPESLELKMIDEALYNACLSEYWSEDFVSNYKDYAMFKRLGLGAVMVKKDTGEIVAGASSYSTYKDGIEIEIVTREDYRKQGLAYRCASKLILECLKRGLYPSWDARTKISVALAEKLGYEYSHEYVAYEINNY
ncbi:MAG: GNAT family N-acetyltransferase [Lachnospiraceae bacterium]|nr:GNAT family N-acetyltransferase [Lachnospiraceae bacterium]